MADKKPKLFYSKNLHPELVKGFNNAIRRNQSPNRRKTGRAVITYKKNDGTLVKREIRPMSAVKSKAGNYLVSAMDYERNAPRTFRMDRIETVNFLKEAQRNTSMNEAFKNGFENKASGLRPLFDHIADYC